MKTRLALMLAWLFVALSTVALALTPKANALDPADSYVDDYTFGSGDSNNSDFLAWGGAANYECGTNCTVNQAVSTGGNPAGAVDFSVGGQNVIVGTSPNHTIPIDYDLSADFMLVEGKLDGRFGLVFGASSSTFYDDAGVIKMNGIYNYYKVDLNVDPNDQTLVDGVRLQRWSGGLATNLVNKITLPPQYQRSTGQWGNLRVVVQNSYITVYVNGYAAIVDYFDATYTTSNRKYGVFMQPQSTNNDATPFKIRFDNIRVKNLTPLTQLTGVLIGGPQIGTTNSNHTFTAAITPLAAAMPITYVWQATDLAPIMHSINQVTDAVNLQWTTVGTKTITITAANPVNIVTNTYSIAIESPDIGDTYEPDDVCAQAQAISTDGLVQSHTFHQPADQDWLVFNAISGTTYLIEALAPFGSPADMALEIYDQCANAPLGEQAYSFSSDVRLHFVAPSTGPLYLKFSNDQPAIYGPHVGYVSSVRQLADTPGPGAVILVAGRLRANDPLQSNIHAVTNAAYQFFMTIGYTATRIYYLAADSALPGYDSSATIEHLQAAITTWALDKVDADHPLTLYLVDHGDYDKLYLDALNGQWVTPQQLDDWLDQLEAVRPGVPINIIIEACKSGSFIDWSQSISKPGRVIISSTSAQHLAWASNTGALFSDHLLNALTRGDSLFTGFLSARSAVLASQPYQFPWLDDSGDGLPNGLQDGAVAQLRSFVTAATSIDDAWPPYIVDATGTASFVNHQGVIQADVVDDPAGGVQRIWGVIYAPSYQPPQTSEELVSEPLSTIELLAEGGDSYAAAYTGFDEVGLYRVVIHAEDTTGVEARPLTIEIRVTGWRVFLPVNLKG